MFRSLTVFIIILFVAPTHTCTSKTSTNTHTKKTNTNPEKYFSFKTTSTWHEFNLPKTAHATQAERWVWTSSLILKSRKAVRVKKLNMQWSGKPVREVYASLYKKRRHHDPLIPIEENLVCDGTWDRKHQQIIFDLNEKIVSANEFFLVLSFPRTITKKLRDGKFTLTRKNSIKLLYLD